MLRVYINGKEVRREDLGEYVVKSDVLQRIISEKIRGERRREDAS